MEQTRVSFKIDSEDHKYLKMYCVKQGITLKSFMLERAMFTAELAEDIDRTTQWRQDGILDVIAEELSDENRKVFELVSLDKHEFDLVETNFQNISGGVTIEKIAQKYLISLSSSEYKDLLKEIYSLTKNPEKIGVVKLHWGAPVLYRIRHRNYSIIFSFNEKTTQVTIVRIVLRGQKY